MSDARVCDEADPLLWHMVLECCTAEPSPIVRLSICRSLRPRTDSLRLGGNHGPIGLVISTKKLSAGECLVRAVFCRATLQMYALGKVRQFDRYGMEVQE